MEKRHLGKFLLLAVLLFIAVVFAILNGPVRIPFKELFLEGNRQILYLRLLRVLLAAITGSGLAVSGAALQAILRNPLAEPYLLGTSSGAGLGAVLAIITGLSSFFLPAVSFLGALVSMVFVYYLSKRGNRIPVESFILSGVIVSLLCSAVIAFLVSVSPNEALHGVVWWLWGSLQMYDVKLLLIAAAIVIPSMAILYVFSQDLNAVSIGEEDALHLGIKIEKIKKIIFFLTSLITAGLVCVSGVIGFVGLILPHITRLWVGPNHRVLLPASCLLGAVFMIVCDLLARTVYAPFEVPIGVITACVGAPVFIVLMKNRQRGK
ncbi:MAG: iron ABC transporter permease [Candidatus Omnitrophota bacterium]|jgi:iron complex transport system permease protein